MLGAGAAGAGDLLAQRPARAEHPHASVARGDPRGARVVFDGEALDLHAPEHVGVLGLQGAGELQGAAARDAGQLLIALGIAGLRREGFEPAELDGAPALVIDDGVSEHPVEPTQRGLPDLLLVIEAAHEHVLEDLFRQGTAAHPFLDVAEELAVVGHEGLDHRCGLRAAGLFFVLFFHLFLALRIARTHAGGATPSVTPPRCQLQTTSWRRSRTRRRSGTCSCRCRCPRRCSALPPPRSRSWPRHNDTHSGSGSGPGSLCS